MAKPKKVKRGDHIVTYVRLKPEDHALIAKIVKKRGYPYTIASVISEMISQSLKAATETAQAGARP